MLRDLEQTPLVTDQASNGYFFHDSLQNLFQYMSSGYRENENGANKSFRIRHIDSPLFDDEKLNQLKGVKYRNAVWQDVICQLSLSRERRGKNRGRISYANLGINQIGSVYESLLAFRGFYAEQDYIEVHPKNKPKEGTLLVPRKRRDDFEDGEVLKDEQGRDVIIDKGRFVYRLSGRDRQKSASYYTPEVLTQCTVKYTFKSILEKHEGNTVFIDVWASWCKDCLKGLPGVKELQANNPEVDFVYLSLDKSQVAWKKGIDRLQIKGEHYFMQSGWKGAMGTFLDLDWIPRYMIIDKQGRIKVFKAIETTDITLLNNLK
jgi:thiol-disulfide isomerase/thioredoxin